MRKLINIAALAIAAICAASSGFAQSTLPTPIYYADAFAQWSINQQSPNTYIFQGRTLCNSQAQNANFFVFNTNAPVYIADQNTANSETVTPSAIVNTAGSCGVTIAPTHSHFTFQLRSGTGGLQESINTVKSGGGRPALIWLDRNWWNIASQVPGTSATAILAAAVGGPGAIITDITSAPPINYVWSGTAYASGTWVNTAPTLTAGAAAGSGPTVANTANSTALSGVANVTTGTSTTTGTLFTEQWVTNTLKYAATCQVASSGANSFTAFTIATTTSGSLNLLTVTATSAPTASTAYSFTYNCQ